MNNVLERVADSLATDMVGHPANLFNQVVFTLVRDHPGGLQGLLDRFTQAGLGTHVASWLSDEPNQPLTARELGRVFDAGEIAALASKLGVSPTEAGARLATTLPDIVNRMTPGNRVDPAFLREILPLLTGKVLD